MNIIVCAKAVPGFIKNPKVSEAQDNVNYEAGSIVINESDDYALEAGVKLAKKTGGKATVLTAGSLSSQKVLQTGLGKDADAALRVDADIYEPIQTARLLAATIKEQEYDVVITGVESSDNMSAQVGVSIAELLGIPFSYAVLDIQPGESEKTIRITKELGFGKTQVEELEIPALVCFQTGTEPPSFVPVRKMMLAQRKPISTVSVGDLAVDELPASVKILEIAPPKEGSLAEMIEGDPAQQAFTLIQKMKEVV